MEEMEGDEEGEHCVAAREQRRIRTADGGGRRKPAGTVWMTVGRKRWRLSSCLVLAGGVLQLPADVHPDLVHSPVYGIIRYSDYAAQYDVAIHAVPDTYSKFHTQY